ncbi:MAG: NusG domain II-containing protein [Eubacteriales bacterium]|nr:NusG domain II-containing protein [Eubacteriales bacterium]
MKTKTWMILIAVLLALCLGASVYILLPREAAAFAEISSGGTVVKTVDLGVDQNFTVPAENGGENTVTVQNGKIAVTAATCPDHYCMARGFCDSGTQIVCLPNKLIIRFLGDQEVDG